MRTRSLVLGGALLLSAFLFGQAPAWLLNYMLAKFAPHSVAMQQPQGSLWNGRAHVQARLPQGTLLDLGQVHWRLRPWTLLTGKISASIEVPDLPLGGRVQTGVSVDLDRVVTLADLRAQLSAALISQFVPQLNLLQPGGTVEVASESLAISTNQVKGKLAATWRGFATKMSKVNPLGDYKLDAQLDNGPINFKLSSPTGPLLIEGSGAWSAATRLNFQGSAKLAPGAPAELASLVRLFGRDQGGGVYAIGLINF